MLRLRMSVANRLDNMTRNPSDLFDHAPQADLFAGEPTPIYRPSPDKVRARLHKILAETKAARSLPWERVSLFRTIVPQLAGWLPNEEANQLCFEFAEEMKRLEAA